MNEIILPEKKILNTKLVYRNFYTHTRTYDSEKFKNLYVKRRKITRKKRKRRKPTKNICMVYFQFLNGKRKIHDTDHKLVYSSVDTYK